MNDNQDMRNIINLAKARSNAVRVVIGKHALVAVGDRFNVKAMVTRDLPRKPPETIAEMIIQEIGEENWALAQSVLRPPRHDA